MSTILILLLLWISPILLYLFIAWLCLPKNSTISDLADMLSDDDYFAPFFLMIMPAINIIALLATIIVVIIGSTSKYIRKYGNIKIK